MSRAECAAQQPVLGSEAEGNPIAAADLTGADLSRANFPIANLTDAKVSPEQLAQAESLLGAIMPDGTTYYGTTYYGQPLAATPEGTEHAPRLITAARTVGRFLGWLGWQLARWRWLTWPTPAGSTTKRRTP